MEQPVDFEITINLMVKWNYKHFTYQFNREKLTITGHSLSAEPDKNLYEYRLTAQELQKISKYLSGFPLGQMEESYIHPTVQGEGSALINIRIGNKSKQVRISYLSEPNLKALTTVLDEVIPQAYKLYHSLWYFDR